MLRARRFASSSAALGLRSPLLTVLCAVAVDSDGDADDDDDDADVVGPNLDLTIARVWIFACWAPRLVTIGEL